MKIKKLQWINAPKKAKIVNSHTFSFLSETEHRLVNTFEEGSFGATIEKDEGVQDALEIIISHRSFIRVSRENNLTLLHFKLSDIETKSYYKTAYNSTWTVEKQASLVTIYLADEKIFSFVAPTTEKSISVCVLTKGSGQVICNFKS